MVVHLQAIAHRADLAKLRRAAGRVVGEGAVEALDPLIADAAVDLEPVGELHRVEQIGGVAGLLPDIMRAEDEVDGTDIIVAAIDAGQAGSGGRADDARRRSEEHTSELQSPMRNSYAGFCLNKNKTDRKNKQQV